MKTDKITTKSLEAMRRIRARVTVSKASIHHAMFRALKKRGYVCGWPVGSRPYPIRLTEKGRAALAFIEDVYGL